VKSPQDKSKRDKKTTSFRATVIPPRVTFVSCLSTWHKGDGPPVNGWRIFHESPNNMTPSLQCCLPWSIAGRKVFGIFLSRSVSRAFSRGTCTDEGREGRTFLRIYDYIGYKYYYAVENGQRHIQLNLLAVVIWYQ
jgi:hypothetical protein